MKTALALALTAAITMKTAQATALTAATATTSDSNSCGNPWYWDSCMWAHYREPCEGESLATSDCGLIYYDAWQYYEWFFSCEDRIEWAWC